MSPAVSRRTIVAACVVLAAATVAAYWRVGGFPFISLDDEAYLVLNPRVKAGLSLQGAAWAFGTHLVANWHPLTWISHMADVSLFGMDAGWHHRVNIALHVANTLLLFGVLYAATGRLPESGIVAGLFALHPLHVESVAWIAERKDLLCALFFFLAVGAYVRYARRPGAARYLAVALFMALSLLAKPMSVTLPFVLLLLDVWPLGRLSLPGSAGDDGATDPRNPGVRRILAEKAPLLLLAAGSSAMTFLAQRGGGAVRSLEALSVPDRVANALASYAGYLGKAAWPVSLSVFYPHPGGSLSAWAVAGSALLLAAVTAATAAQARKRPYLAVGWLWFLGTLVPVIGLIQVGAQGMADRYTYLPLVGIFVMVTWGGSELAGRLRLPWPAAAAVAAVVLSLLGLQTWRQAGYWRSSDALFTRALEVTEGNFVACQHLGAVRLREGRTDEALSLLGESVRLEPVNYQSRNLLGMALARANREDEALQQFQWAATMYPSDPQAYFETAVILARRGRTGDAIGLLRTSLALDPDSAAVRMKLGNLLMGEGKAREASVQFAEAARLDPGSPVVRYNLGVALEGLGDPQGAADQYREAIRLRPEYGSAHNNLGVILFREGRRDEAIAHLREALKSAPDDPAARRNLDDAVRARGSAAGPAAQRGGPGPFPPAGNR